MNTKEISSLRGTVGAGYVKQHGNTAFIYTALIAIENIVVEEILYYFDIINSLKHYKITTDIIVAYNKETEKQHCIIAEAGFKSTSVETLGKSGTNIAVTIGEENYKEYLQRSGTWEFTLNFKVRSTTRASVAILADELYIGLQTDIYERLRRRNITISFNKVKISNLITPRKIAGDVQVYEVNFDINTVSVPWVLLTELTGEIIKNFVTEPTVDDPLTTPDPPPLPGGQELSSEELDGYGYDYGEDYGY